MVLAGPQRQSNKIAEDINCETAIQSEPIPARRQIPRSPRQAVEGRSARRPGCGVQPALLLAFVFPPPASGAFRLVGADRSRAGGAADRGETLRVQRIARHCVSVGKAQQCLAVPIVEWAELDEAAFGIRHDESGLFAMGGLV